MTDQPNELLYLQLREDLYLSFLIENDLPDEILMVQTATKREPAYGEARDCDFWADVFLATARGNLTFNEDFRGYICNIDMYYGIRESYQNALANRTQL